MHRATLVACTPPLSLLPSHYSSKPSEEIRRSEQVCTIVGRHLTLLCIVARVSSPMSMDRLRRTSKSAIALLLVRLNLSISFLSVSDYSFLREIPPLCLAAFFSRMASFFCLFVLGV